MSKTALVLSILVLSVASLTDKEIIQTVLNANFHNNSLSDPTTIVPCIDDDTAHKIVVFIGDTLKKGAKLNVVQLPGLIADIKKFGDSIPQPVKDCLNGNEELAALGLKYGIDDTTDEAALEAKIIKYIGLHYLQVHGWIVTLNDNWNGAKPDYTKFGNDAATYAHTLLGVSEEVNLTDKEILQQLLNGLFEVNSLPDPTTIVPCIDDATAHQLVIFIGDVLKKAASISASKFESLINEIKAEGDQIPQPVKDCLDGNQEFKDLGLKYGIDDTTDSSKIEKKVIEYVTLHYLKVHKSLGQMSSDWQDGKPYTVGHNMGTLGHDVLGSADRMIRFE